MELPGEIFIHLMMTGDYYYTYVLISEADGKFYIGYSSNVEKRFQAHMRGQVDSTRHRLPLQLIYYEACLDKSDAKKREKYLKTHYGRMYLKST